MDNENMKYVAYYRVSTQQQGASGLGLEAQQADVNRFTCNIIASFTDIESGKRSDNRPQLLEAIKYCNDNNATLVVAKLDRLSRNVIFIHTLMESKVKFICCDMPQANELTIGIMAVIAQAERSFISERTKKALKAAKERGVKLGGATPEHMQAMREARQPKKYSRTITNTIQLMKSNGSTFQQIADELNKQDLKTDRKNPYSATQVYRIYHKLSIVTA